LAGDSHVEQPRALRERFDAATRGIAVRPALNALASRTPEMNDKRGERYTARDMERPLRFGDSRLALDRVGAGERHLHRGRVDGDQLQAGARQPLLYVGDDGRVVIVDVEARRKQFGGAKPVRRDFQQVVSYEASIAIEVGGDRELHARSL